MLKKLSFEAEVSTETSWARRSLLEPLTNMDEIGANFCLSLLSKKMDERSSGGITLNHVAILASVFGAVTLFVGSLGAANVLFLSREIVLALLFPLVVLSFFAATIMLSALPGNYKTANRIGYMIAILGFGVIYLFPEASYAFTCAGVMLIGLAAVAAGVLTIRRTEFYARASAIFAAERRLDRLGVNDALMSAVFGMYTIAGMLGKCRKGADQAEVVDQTLAQFHIRTEFRDTLGFRRAAMRNHLESLIQLDRQQSEKVR